MNVSFDPARIRAVLHDLDRPCYVVRCDGRLGVTSQRPRPGSGVRVLAAASPVGTPCLGASAFLRRHGTRQPYMAGSMAGGISSEELVVALARTGHLASFGAAGLAADRVEQAVLRLSGELPGLPWACNLIHSPAAPEAERRAVDIYLRHQVPCVEASAFLRPTPDLVRYRAAGLRSAPDGGVHVRHRVIAKVSQAGTAAFFLRPAPAELLVELTRQGLITDGQARLAARVPLADDITVEADSAGHTDRRPLVTQLPLIIALRDREAAAGRPGGTVGIGAAGGIGTPQAAFAAFSMGAAYIVTGSVNQACVEAGTSPAVKELLAQADVGDCAMAPSADMFEMGVDVQVLKRGTLFPGRAAWLYRLYREHAGLDDLSPGDRARLEEQVLRRPLDEVWSEVADHLRRHRPGQAELAERTPKLRMALMFRWYLGLSSRWATRGEPDGAADYQIWCGPAMGAFNAWTRDTPWSAPGNRHAAGIARALLRGAAFHSRLAQLRFAGVHLPASVAAYLPSDADPTTRPDSRVPANRSSFADA
ncbi:PfaD family polyunsaturated fatty acid/polyketide biosynthesis protein [Streptomyces griseocarneus]|uniref:PfaD family polyunsaturated fatty acid/polyketide biosynthesis protein n=1 Tax=Streptomyces griseocarneus TaxID=51201 RepID=UPI00167EC635|nr:PfaD family polyunsaturated fatty acid/polyketide biosynthesis protein [Streptomyces griseocarneus]MBZ6475909.1 PfaD family polyunsaturated fatty acid/polyketide biosynthesis protein [Streptomyces griseocarneus]GHG50074.1 2-nitropropane dioxygenase [Streptomyces griseocarneus]